MFDPTRPFIDDNFVSLTICQNAICLLKLCSCNSCGAKQENRYKSVQMVDRCLWMKRWSILKPFLAFVATTVVLIRLVFMTIRWCGSTVKDIFLGQMVKISNCQIWNFNQERKNGDQWLSKVLKQNQFDEWHNLCSCEFPQITKLTFCWFCGHRQIVQSHSREVSFLLQGGILRLQKTLRADWVSSTYRKHFNCNFEYPRAQCDPEIEACF